MEAETLASYDHVAAAAKEEAAQRQAEIGKLRSERANLQSDLEAALAQVGMLRAAVKELQGSNASLESQILQLQGNISSLQEERMEEAGRADSDRRALEAIAARAAELEGDVSRLQHDLVAAESEGAEAIVEVNQLRESVHKLQGEVTVLEAKLSEASKAEDVLKLSVERLAGEKNVLAEAKDQAEAKIAGLEGKLRSLESEVGRVLEEKENELARVRLAMAELEEKVGVYEVKLEKTREVENGEKVGVDGRAEQTAVEGRVAVGFKFPWKTAAASAGSVAAVAMVACYLHHAKSRST